MKHGYTCSKGLCVPLNDIRVTWVTMWTNRSVRSIHVWTYLLLLLGRVLLVHSSLGWFCSWLGSDPHQVHMYVYIYACVVTWKMLYAPRRVRPQHHNLHEKCEWGANHEIHENIPQKSGAIRYPLHTIFHQPHLLTMPTCTCTIVNWPWWHCACSLHSVPMLFLNIWNASGASSQYSLMLIIHTRHSCTNFVLLVMMILLLILSYPTWNNKEREGSCGNI